ncbi:tyrosine-type recombinase/integrase [Vibrio astriarenae]
MFLTQSMPLHSGHSKQMKPISFQDLEESCALNHHYFTPRSAKGERSYTPKELRDRYLALIQGDDQLSDKTKKQYERHLGLYIELWPYDDLAEMDRENAELFLNLFYKYPKNPEKNRLLSGLQGFELIKKNEEINGEVISRRTVKKIINVLSAFFRWAEAHHYVNDNPFFKLKVRKALITDKRLPLTSNDLMLIFNMQDYKRGAFLHSYYYWLPLLLRFTGARMNELCQLYTCDVVKVDGVWGICINASQDGQRVKNQNSLRYVPLHHALISRGFIDYVQSCCSGRLFPMLPKVNGYFSHNATKWFARRRKSLGLEKGKDGHSFRHSFINELKQQNVPISVIQEVVGHSHQSVTTAVYSRSYEPEVLLKAINLIDDSHVSEIKPFTHY